ncbi:hypothetical protein C8J56DRAFT_1115404 [Mycena floridula]|nr:hypothetical protein C8J56DRAFT_1115404 [Mycena floridula]
MAQTIAPSANTFDSSVNPSELRARCNYKRGYIPTNITLFLGRDPEVEELVRLLTRVTAHDGKRARICMLGPGGMGKTELATKVMNHPEIQRCYRLRNLLFLACVQALSASALLDILHAALDITQDSPNTLNDILDELRSSGPLIILLDNFETPLYADGAREDVEQILRDIEQIPHVALLVTMRGSSPPCEGFPWIERRIKPLDPEPSHRLFTEIYPRGHDDLELGQLLEVLGYMPLAVTLMAKLGKTTKWKAGELLQSFQQTGTTMLGSSDGSDSRHSVNVSIRLSVESPLMQRTRDAAVLLAIISMLPSGTTSNHLQKYWGRRLSNLVAALQTLLDTSLLECRSDIYIVLPVIRSYILEPSRVPTEVTPLMVEGACKFLEEHNSDIEEPLYQRHMLARSAIEINLQSILLTTIDSKSDIIRALRILAWHQYYTRPRLEVIQHAVELAEGLTDYKLQGRVLRCYGAILYELNRYNDALEQYKLARKSFIRASDTRNAAFALLKIAEISTMISPQYNEIPLIKQAQIELTYSNNPAILKLIRRCRFLCPLLPSKQPVANEDIARCLTHLGEAYSRHRNYSKAIKPFTRARGMCSEGSFERAGGADELAAIHHRLGNYQEAEKWALQACKEWKHVGGYTERSLRILGRIYISNLDYDKAIRALSEGLEAAKIRGSVYWTAQSLLELGRAYMKKGEIENARSTLVESISHYQKLENKDNRMARQSVADAQPRREGSAPNDFLPGGEYYLTSNSNAEGVRLEAPTEAVWAAGAGASSGAQPTTDMSDSDDFSASEAASTRPARNHKKSRRVSSGSDSEEYSGTDEESVVCTRQKRKPQPRKPVNEDSDSASGSGSDETDAATEGTPFFCSHCGHKHGSQRYISPIPKHLLQTNDPPLESEQVSLQQIIDNADFDQEIADVDDTISRTEYLLRCLRRRRLEIQASALAAKGVTSAIRRVPREVIMAIVLYALGDGIGAATLDTSKGPWVYSQVCRLWREEILSCRAIWANVDINVPKEEKGCGQWATVLKTVLARASPRKSKNPCLRFQLCLASDSNLTRDLLQSLVESSLSWVEATLILPRTILPRLKKLKDRLPLLQKLRIEHTSARSSSKLLSSTSLRGLFNVAPALRHLTVIGFRHVDKILLPWSQITHFNDGESFGFETSALASMTNIVTLTIPTLWRSNAPFADLRFVVKSEIRLSTVKRLDLSFFNDSFTSSASPLLSFFILPALEELSTSCSLESVIGMIEKSSCSLKRLELRRYGPAFSINFLSRLFALISASLESLDLSPIPSESLSLLLDHINVTGALPVLQTITFCPSVLAQDSNFFSIKEFIRLRKDPKTAASIAEILFRNSPNAFAGGHWPATVKSRFTLLQHLSGEEMKLRSET